MKLIDRLRRALAVGTGNHSATLLERALALHEAGDLEGAQEIYAEMLKRNVRDADALHLTGLIAHQRGDNARAQQLIGQAITARPTAPRFHFNLGNALAAQGKPREAAISFQRSASLDPAHAPSWYNLGSALARLDEHNKSAEALRRAFDIAPELPGLRQALAQVLSNAAGAGTLPPSAYHEAADLLLHHWHLSEDPVEARQLLALALKEDRQWTLAAEHYLALIDAFPNLELAHNNLANCYNQLGRMTDAIEEYREVLRLSPTNALAASGIVSCMNYNASAKAMFEAHTDWARDFVGPAPAFEQPRYRAAAQARLCLARSAPPSRGHAVRAGHRKA
jgi:protein O-GlcNAc transferase